MMDERSKNMRDLLFALPTKVHNNAEDALRDAMICGTGVYTVPTMGYIPKRCLCCGGIGINHDE